MTTLDLAQDPELIFLLRGMIRGAYLISIHDSKLAQNIAELKSFYSAPNSVDYSALDSSVKKLAELVKSYDLKLDKESQEENQTLPTIIYNFSNKLDDLKAKVEINQKHFSFAELDERLNYFCKITGAK